jgi:hypothetical protein
MGEACAAPPHSIYSRSTYLLVGVGKLELRCNLFSGEKTAIQRLLRGRCSIRRCKLEVDVTLQKRVEGGLLEDTKAILDY